MVGMGSGAWGTVVSTDWWRHMSADIRPYYRSEDGFVIVYHARWEAVVAAGLVDAIRRVIMDQRHLSDRHERTARATAGRGLQAGGKSFRTMIGKNGQRGTVRGIRDFPAVIGDDGPFDPAPLAALSRPTVLWGANHYGSRLPDSPSWILWDKREEQTPDDNADGELAWSNLGGPLRIFRHFWRGALRKTEKIELHLHPTQKPIALCTWVYQRAKLKRGDLVFVPHMGSGPDLAAACAMGLRIIACDVEEWCCRTAVGARATPEERAKRRGRLRVRGGMET